MYHAVLVLVDGGDSGGSCCCIPYQLALMLVLTFAPCALTFAPCTCGVILPSTYSTCTHGGGHCLHLALVFFFIPPTGAHTSLALEQLVLCGSGL